MPGYSAGDPGPALIPCASAINDSNQGRRGLGPPESRLEINTMMWLHSGWRSAPPEWCSALSHDCYTLSGLKDTRVVPGRPGP